MWFGTTASRASAARATGSGSEGARAIRAHGDDEAAQPKVATGVLSVAAVTIAIVFMVIGVFILVG
jgi:hypothetical protein